jgi:hypothetical protein
VRSVPEIQRDLEAVAAMRTHLWKHGQSAGRLDARMDALFEEKRASASGIDLIARDALVDSKTVATA